MPIYSKLNLRHNSENVNTQKVVLWGECISLSLSPSLLVLAAVSAARKVVISKPGQRAIFECSSSDYKDSVRWYQGEVEILRIIKKSGFVHKGRDGLSHITTVCCFLNFYNTGSTYTLVFSALGMAKVGERAKLKNLNLPTLEISGVKEEDAGEFKCNMDGKIQEYLLFVVSGEQRTKRNCILWNLIDDLRFQIRANKSS